jgi:hypothetical protein
MPAAKRGFVAQLLTLLKDQSIRRNGTRIIRVVPSFDDIFLMVIEMRLSIFICVNTRNLHNSTYPIKFHANLSLTWAPSATQNIHRSVRETYLP